MAPHFVIDLSDNSDAEQIDGNCCISPVQNLVKQEPVEESKPLGEAMEFNVRPSSGQPSSIEHIEVSTDNTSEQVNESFEHVNSETLPDADAVVVVENEFDADGFAALVRFNENKDDMGGKGTIEIVPEADWDGRVHSENDSVQASGEPLGSVVNDDGHVMNWQALIDEDAAAGNELAANAFAERKRQYEENKAQGTNTQADDIRFAAEEYAENRRIRNLERSQMEVEDPPQPTSALPHEDEDSLFVPEMPAVPKPQPKKRAAPKPRNRLSKKDMDDAIAAGIQAEFGTARAPKHKARAPSGEPTQLKTKRPTASTAGVKKKPQKRGRRPNLSNIASLGRTNIVAAAQANAFKPDMPTFTATNKAKALRELISSIPSADRTNASSDRNAILEASKKFRGKGAMRSDGHGGWILKGMASSLYNHQLLGTAFLRDRETGQDKPNGGMVCDDMGFGKTIQMIANMIDGRAKPGSAVKTTLIVAPPTLLNQWMEEMDKHVQGASLGRILRYHSGSRLQSNDVVSDLMSFDVILTTYGEVQKSYPLCEPPKHLVSDEKKNEWWKKYYSENVGPLHRIKFHRIVLDEAHHIKNHQAKTSVAVRGLTGNFKWCITGTPILNYVEELYPYFSFLKVPHTGSYSTFCHNYCQNRGNRKETVPLGRVHNILRTIMLRRTHEDTLFNAPIVKLPGITHNTVLVEFNAVERNIYNMVKSRYVEQINTFSKSGSLMANYGNILTMILRLRMLCSHIFLIQDVLKQMFNAADVETLWRLTAKDVQTCNDPDQLNVIQALRKNIATGKIFLQTTQTKGVQPAPGLLPDMQHDLLNSGSDYGLDFKFRKFLRSLTESDTWAELHLRSTCAKCRNPPDDPVCTSCFHVYCRECILALHRESEERGNDKIACLQCQTLFEETTPCSGLAELGFGGPDILPMVERKRAQLEKQKQQAKKAAMARRGTSNRPTSILSEDSDEETGEGADDWIAAGGAMLPSAKLAGAKAAILNWRERHSTQKIIVYTQFLDLGRIFAQICEAEGWGCVAFNGKMSIDARNKAITDFRDEPNIVIMICSLKAGGVGLNLTMASKVIILDLWFNSSVEAQAYCRAFRIGQNQIVDVLRFVVKDSIDEDLIKMQELKDIEVREAIGSDNMRKRATITQLLELFGDVEGEGENQFILVEEDCQEEEDADVQMADRLPPRPF